MTSLFPVGATLSWSVIKDWRFATRKQQAVSGRQLRLLDQPYPIRTWTLTYELLRDKNDLRQAMGSGYGYDELRTLAGFYAQMQGSFQSFWFDDPTENYNAGTQFGTGDGSNLVFQLLKVFGGFTEPAWAINNLEAVYVDGNVADPTTYSVNASTGIVTFIGGSAPGNGAVLTADFSFYFWVHFSEDTISFENFMYQLWTLKQVKLEAVIL